MTGAWGAEQVVRTPVVLVVGSSGFLGAHIVEALRTEGFSVATAGRRVRSAAGSVPMDVVAGDFHRLASDIRRVRPDVVVNCVGVTRGNPAAMVAGNVTGTLRLFEVVAKAAPDARFIHLGSAAEYGITDVGRPITEGTAEAPVSPYGVTKLAGTRSLLGRGRDLRVLEEGGVVVLRIFNPIGAGAPASSLPGRVVRQMYDADLGDPPLGTIETAPLSSYRDWVDARDIGSAVVAAARADSASGIYNIGAGRAVQCRELVDLIGRVCGFRGTVAEAREQLSRSGAVPWQQADISRALADLGWYPRYDLAESVRHLWNHATEPAGALV